MCLYDTKNRSMTEPTLAMTLHFNLRFHTEFGQTLWLSGSIEELGMNDPAKAIPLTYINSAFWGTEVVIEGKSCIKSGITYKYYLRNKEGEMLGEWGNDRSITQTRKSTHDIRVIDTWNHAGEYENAF